MSSCSSCDAESKTSKHSESFRAVLCERLFSLRDTSIVTKRTRKANAENERAQLVKIGIRTDGYKEIGLGHVYRAIILANALSKRGHDVIVISLEQHESGIEKMRDAGIAVIVTTPEGEHKTLAALGLDALVLDVLSTSSEYVAEMRKTVRRIVNIEDRGDGAYLADVVINGIYEREDDEPGEDDGWYWGTPYICLRDEVVTAAKRNAGMDTGGADVMSDKKELLATFGGTDPLDLSSRVYYISKRLHERDEMFHTTLVLGPGYAGKVSLGDSCDGVSVLQNVNNLHELMDAADIAICSQGTTVYELACLGTPAIVISQNKRETTHSFACDDNGFMNLGLGSAIDDDEIESSITHLMASDAARKSATEKMLALDLSGGVERVCMLICADAE